MKRIFACAFGLALALHAGPSAAMTPLPLADKAELKCLALVVYWEARSEPPIDQRAVAYVALNRTEHPEFPDDICGVVKQGGTAKRGACQFSWWCDGRDDTPREAEAWREAIDTAEAVIEGDSDDPTDGALFFHGTGVHPKWAAVKEKTAKIGRHIFYR